MSAPDTPVEQVAEAIWRASTGREDPWDSLNTPQKSHWRRLSRAAVEALQLTDEWGVITDMGHVPLKPMTEDRARKLAAQHDDKTARRRLVGPWRTAE